MTPRDPFAVVQSALAVTPSPEFAARVRMRVVAAPSVPTFESSWRSVWMCGAVAAAAVAVVITVSVDRSRTIATPVEVAHGAGAPESVVTNAESRAVATVPVLPRRSALRTATVATPLSARAADTFYDVIVPDDQRIALERLLAAMKAGRAAVPRSAMTTEVDEDGNMVIAPLPDIVPVKIESLAGTPADNIKRDEVKK